MKKISSTLLLLFASITIFIGTGCKSEPKDADVKTSVESALQANPETTGLSVAINDGVATLTGEVKDAAAKSEASTIAGAVKGVKSVSNNVTVAQTVAAPVEITADDPLSAAVRDATKDFQGVVATVNDGIITVAGEIKSADWKRLKPMLDALRPKKVDAVTLKINN
ncbi:MAG: BON domain-containing protein [Chitinophagaceae bacterium]|nr:BON domain-containing protein [Chitinophagaceae bacterium]